MTWKELNELKDNIDNEAYLKKQEAYKQYCLERQIARLGDILVSFGEHRFLVENIEYSGIESDENDDKCILDGYAKVTYFGRSLKKDNTLYKKKFYCYPTYSTYELFGPYDNVQKNNYLKVVGHLSPDEIKKLEELI